MNAYEGGEMVERTGLVRDFNGNKNKILALMLCLVVSNYVAIPNNATNNGSDRKNIDCTGLIAFNHAQFA
jgi:hypothetical protein